MRGFRDQQQRGIRDQQQQRGIRGQYAAAAIRLPRPAAMWLSKLGWAIAA
jgi:hypothetical protein